LGDSLTLRERFVGTLVVRSAGGSTRPVRITLRQWVVNGGHSIRQLADSGVLLVQLRSGNAAVSIGDRRFEPAIDTFFVVPAGAGMSVTTGQDEAVFEVLSIRDP
jgi:gentisate 1,2-dioxygenase